MADNKLTALVKAQMTVEFEVGTWEGGTSFNDLHEQVSREAVQKLRSLTQGKVKIVGEPVIKVVTFTQET